MRPGDRKQRWQSSCTMGGFVMLGFAVMVFVSASGVTGKAIGVLLAIPALLEFVDAKRGWKIRYDLPPKYYRDIKSSNPLTRQIAKDAAEATLKEAKDPNRKRYAFDKRRHWQV